MAVVTQPDRPVGRKKVLTPPPVKVEAEKHGIPVYQPEKIREEEELEKSLALNPDLIVTAAFGQILPNEILEAPKYGCINVHASLFQNYAVVLQFIMRLCKEKRKQVLPLCIWLKNWMLVIF